MWGLMVALVLSVALNIGMGVAFVDQQKEAAVTEAQQLDRIKVVENERDAKAQVAEECSSAVAVLAGDAKDRKAQGDQARAAVQPQVVKHKAAADALLAKPAPVLGDVCASAQGRVDEWLIGRVR